MNQRTDRIRQIVVAVTTAAAIVGAFLGSGALGGTPIDEAAGGAFAADATVVAPAAIAFSIWSVIYLGLAAYAVWQAFPAQGAKLSHRSIGYALAASALLNAAWIACVQAGRIAESFVIIVLLLAVLLVAFARVCRRSGRGSIAEIVLIDGTVGLYLGWVTVAAAANLAAWLAAIGLREWEAAPGTPGLFLLIAAGVVAVWTALRGGRWAPAAATAWGLLWIAVERWRGAPQAPLVAAGAVVIALVVLALTAWRFRRRTRAD